MLIQVGVRNYAIPIEQKGIALVCSFVFSIEVRLVDNVLVVINTILATLLES